MFWDLTYPFLFPDSRMERAEEQADGILELTGISSGSLLDLCCGPGRFSMAMARRGFSVTGVDRTTALIETATRTASVEGLEIEWVLSDMRDFSRPSSYDLALSMFTSFGYFEKHEDNMKVLRNIHMSLKPGGRLLLEVMGKEVLASVFSPVSTTELEDGSLLIQKHSIEHGWNRISNDWILIRDDAIEGRFRFTHWVYSAMELEAMLLEAGFDLVSVFGSMDGSPYDDSARELVALAVRGG